MLNLRQTTKKGRAGAVARLGAALSGLAAAACLAGTAGAAPLTLTYHTGEEVPDLSGFWKVDRYIPGVRTLDGEMPPLTEEARAQYEQNMVELEGLPPRDDMTRCVPPGVPRINFAPFPMLILQTERKVTLVYEYHHILRHVYMDEALPPEDEMNYSFLGDSVGHWDGEALVVETNGFNDTTYLDREGMPHSPNMRLTERFSLLGDGDQLEIVMTIDDPETYTEPWSTRLVLDRAPEATLEEYNCWLRYEDF